MQILPKSNSISDPKKKLFTNFRIVHKILKRLTSFERIQCPKYGQISKIRYLATMKLTFVPFQFIRPFIAHFVEITSNIIRHVVALLQSLTYQIHVNGTGSYHQTTHPMRIGVVPFAQFRKPIVRFQWFRIRSINIWINLVDELMIGPVTPSEFFAENWLENYFVNRRTISSDELTAMKLVLNPSVIFLCTLNRICSLCHASSLHSL